jgi:hypothetical protein
MMVHSTLKMDRYMQFPTEQTSRETVMRSSPGAAHDAGMSTASMRAFRSASETGLTR